MAESPEEKSTEKKGDESDEVLLVAEVRAHLHNGDSIDLLPFKHPDDVRAEVNKFIEDWVKTGFLLKQNFLYPWHQVRSVEVVSVHVFSHAQAKPYLDDWQSDTEAQKAFWKTRKPQAKAQGEKKEESSQPAH